MNFFDQLIFYINLFVRIQKYFEVILTLFQIRKIIIYAKQMNKKNEINIFCEEKQETTMNQLSENDNIELPAIPYLKRGDSNIYLDQFLIKGEDEIKPQVKQQSNPLKEQNQSSFKDDDQFEVEQGVKLNPSAFHNFQKHLAICLKYSIQFPSQDKISKDYQIAASKLWKIFKNSTINTKKFLHYLLGEKNQHPITESGLKQYGLKNVYERYGEETMREGRKYLRVQTIRQIEQGRLQYYILDKKMKDKQKFKKYVEIFIQELRQGYLRKRLPKNKVNQLLSY